MLARKNSKIRDWSPFEGVGVGIAVIDRNDHSVQYINSQMVQLGFYKPEEAIGQCFVGLYFPHNTQAILNLFQLEPLSPEIVLTETQLKIRKKSGKLSNVDISVKNLENTDLKLITVIDCEPRCELERELELAYQQMIESSKFISLAEMAAGIAHEINNPLAIIYALTEQLLYLAQRNQLPMSKVEDVSQKILKSTNRASKIVESLKALASGGDVEGVEVVDLREILHQSAGLSREKLLQQSIDFKIEVPEQPVYVNVNSGQIIQVFLNLLENSRYALKDCDDRQIIITIKSNHGFVEIKFQDSGPGIPENFRKEIMNPFFTSKPVGEGTGLGLSISKAIVKKYKGTLTCCDVEKGACFLVSLPSIEHADARKPMPRVVGGIHSSNIVKMGPSEAVSENKKILIVEDEDDLANAMFFGLKEFGHEVSCAKNGMDALGILQEENFEVILSDIKMPELTGVELLGRVRKELKKDIPFIIVTGSSGANSHDLESMGAHAVLQKPLSLKNLIEVIDSIDCKREKRKIRKRFKVKVNDVRRTLLSSVPIETHRIANFNEGGLFIEEREELPSVGDLIQVVFEYSFEDNSGVISDLARVKWVQDADSDSQCRGFGVEFQNLSAVEKQSLQLFSSYLEREGRSE